MLTPNGKEARFKRYLFTEIYLLKECSRRRKCFHFHHFIYYSVHKLKPRNKASINPKDFSFANKIFLPPYLTVSSTFSYFSPFLRPVHWKCNIVGQQTDLSTENSFPFGHILHEIRKKGPWEKSRQQTVYFGCSAFYQLGWTM